MAGKTWVEEAVTVDCIGRECVSEGVTFKLRPCINQVSRFCKLDALTSAYMNWLDTPSSGELDNHKHMTYLSHLVLAACFLFTSLQGMLFK